MSSTVEHWKDQLGALPDDERAELSRFQRISPGTSDLVGAESLWKEPPEAWRDLVATAKGRPLEDDRKEHSRELSEH